MDDGFGDLLPWFQTIAHAKTTQKPITLVTDDRKEDWWNVIGGKPYGPRLELRKEMMDEAKVPLLMETVDTFLRHANRYAGAAVSQETIDETERVRETEETRSRRSALEISPEMLRALGETQRMASGIDPSIFRAAADAQRTMSMVSPSLLRAVADAQRMMSMIDPSLLRAMANLSVTEMETDEEEPDQTDDDIGKNADGEQTGTGADERQPDRTDDDIVEETDEEQTEE